MQDEELAHIASSNQSHVYPNMDSSNKTLYTNISLREISQSPDTRPSQGGSGFHQQVSNKVVIASSKNQISNA